MLKINTKTELVDFKGEPFTLTDGEKLTVGTVVSSILGGKVSDPTLGWILGKKFATQDEVDLKAEDVVFVKKEVEENGKSQGGGYTALITGQIIEMLDGARS
jgi:hypothetical protein